MSSITCGSCKLNLITDTELRSHYKSEFHQYNIKRSLVGLGPVSSEIFEQKKAQLQDKQSSKAEEYRCKLCSKEFSSEGTYNQHKSSKKHKEAEKKGVKPREIPGPAKSDTSKDIISLDSSLHSASGRRMSTVDDQSVCLFCNKKNSCIDSNLDHMKTAHSFFISEARHMKNVQGLLNYLGKKIHIGCLCIYCENIGRDFRTGAAVQAHMLDKGHCFMNTDHFGEYGDYYDFSREGKSEDSDGYTYIVADKARDEKILNLDGEDDWEDDEIQEEEGSWDSDDGEEEKLSEEEKLKREFREARFYRQMQHLKRHKAHLLPKGEIRLSNGAIIGHREFKKYYKQFYREQSNTRLDRLGVPTDERQLVLTNTQRQIILNQIELGTRKLHPRPHYDSKYSARKSAEKLGLGMRGNLTLMKHYKHSTP